MNNAYHSRAPSLGACTRSRMYSYVASRPAIHQSRLAPFCTFRQFNQQLLRVQQRKSNRHTFNVIFARDGKNTTQESTGKGLRSQGATPQKGPEGLKGSGWRFFDLEAYQIPWEVPWGAKTLVAGFLAWAASFALVGVLLVPLAVELLGVENLRSLPAIDKAYLLLFNQVAETAVGLGVIAFTIRNFNPLPDDLFVASLREPLTPSRGWLVWGLLGVLLSPLDVGAAAFTAQAFGFDDVGGRGTAEGVATIISLDLPTYVSLFLVTAVLAPILEETVFRGFILTSLTKWFPVPVAVLVSAVAFGAAHLTPRDFPQLTALGVLLGFTYVRSRNLLTPMMIHGAWNGTVLTLLFLLASYGVDLPEFLAGGFVASPAMASLSALSTLRDHAHALLP
eukprot:jgi/Botrbrau1/5830/Bobra.0366s0012.2